MHIWKTLLATLRLLVGLLVCLAGHAEAEGKSGASTAPEAIGGYFTVQLPPIGSKLGNCIEDGGNDECVEIPGGRPIYALLVSGFHQNQQLDMFHWYNFAKCLLEKGAYVHYSWWNNLLAPYMERPLHDPDSVPSLKANPWEEVVNILPVPAHVPKANPRDDYQFQQDAAELLKAIHEHNPGALIILVGHSMGGDAVARLAARADLQDIDIALLAPIDPVGNRSCHPSGPYSFLPDRCQGLFNFSRYQTTHEDYWWTPAQRHFGTNVKYLYYRYQKEGLPPFDYGFDHYFSYQGPRVPTIEEAMEQGSTNVQSRISNSLLSDRDVPLPGLYLGAADGHGEIVGFRGVRPEVSIDWANLLWVESYPLALRVPGTWLGPFRPASEWPLGKCETYESDPNAMPGECRVEHLMKWHEDPNYLYKAGFEPYNPGLCMVSKDMCNILDTIAPDVPEDENQPPTADAGPSQTISADGDCWGQAALDGTGSTDPEDDELTYTWTWEDGGVGAAGPDATIDLPVGEHEISLVVNDGELDSDPEWVVITVVDATPPLIELQGWADMVVECGVEAWEDPGAFATDNCDPDVAVYVTGDTVDSAVPGIYTIAYEATDASGNMASQVIRTVVVQDTTPPTIESITANPATLWPPNHSMVPIHITVTVNDSCDAAPDIMLATVTSDEPDDAPGGRDGRTRGDIRDADIGTQDYDILLRAERRGGGNGRIYAMTYAVTDDSGNSAGSSVTVTVEHDMSFWRKILLIMRSIMDS